MSRRDTGPLDSKIYVGGLPEQASRSELEAVFSRYGRLRNVWVARRPPGFAFVEFDDPRDAADAARALDGTRICGSRVRVEISHGRPRGNGPPLGSRYSSTWEERHGGGGGGGGGYNKFHDRSPRGMRGRSRSRSPAPRRYNNRSRSITPPRGGGGGGGGRYGSRSRSRE